MKAMIRLAVLGLGVVLASASAARAETLEVTIPFPFTVGAETLPAGHYRVERDSFRSPSIVVIRGDRGRTAQLMLQTTPLHGARPATPALVFAQDEIAHRLTAVWESALGYELSTPRRGSRLLGQVVVAAQRRS